MNKQINLQELFKILKENLKIILVTPVVFALIGFGLSSYLNEDVYSSSTSLIVGEERSVETGELNPVTFEPIYIREIVYDSNVAISERSVNFYTKLIKSNEILEQLIDDMKLQTSVEDMKNNISITTSGDSSIIEVEVNSKKLQNTNEIANELSKLFISTLSETIDTEAIKIINLADEVNIKKSENVMRNTIVITVLGFIIGIFIVLLTDFFDDKISTENDLTKLGLTVLADIKSESNNAEDELKIVYTKIQNYYDNENLKNILLLPVSKEASSTSIKLASVISKSSKKVLLLDANFRNPHVHKKLNLSNDSGFLNILEKSNEIESTLESDVDNSNMDILTSGESNQKITDLLYLDNMKNILEKISPNYNYIISNASPINNISDSLIMSILSDGVILVISRKKDSITEVGSVLQQLERLNVKILGAILE